MFLTFQNYISCYYFMIENGLDNDNYVSMGLM
jgi:hypothetical protein